jgi:hypothetical protein
MSGEACTRLEGHKAHMCQLKAEGCIEQMDKHSAKPNFTCNKCGAKAEAEDFLCQPRPL